MDLVFSFGFIPKYLTIVFHGLQKSSLGNHFVYRVITKQLLAVEKY